MIFERLRSIISEQFSVSESSISMDTSFVDDLGADSLDAVDLIMAIEEAFDVPEFSDELIEGIITVGDLFKFISDNCD
jgi:acyl carrier protein